MPRANTARQVASATSAGIGATYVVAELAPGVLTHAAGGEDVLAYRAEAAFAAAGALDGTTFKVQVSRTADGAAVATDARWTDLALRDAANPGAAAAVDITILTSPGNTVARDLFSDLGHRGREHFRVLVRRSGADAAVAGDSFALWGPR